LKTENHQEDRKMVLEKLKEKYSNFEKAFENPLFKGGFGARRSAATTEI